MADNPIPEKPSISMANLVVGKDGKLELAPWATIVADKPIPEDLTEDWDTVNRLQKKHSNEPKMVEMTNTIIGYILRIGRAEQTVASQRELLDKYDADNTALVQENAALKEQKKPENIIVRCSYCEEEICDREFRTCEGECFYERT